MNIKAIIFDWGRTLFDSDAKKEFPESEEVLKYCKAKGYKLATLSLVTEHANAGLEERKNQVEKSPLRELFDLAMVTDTNKDELFEEIVSTFKVPANKIAIIDDRVIRGIKWGNRNGSVTIWLQKGKFSSEMPNDETGQPKYIIRELKELLQIL
jgi:FMN phosphatase YigB (HAD superfamily)